MGDHRLHLAVAALREGGQQRRLAPKRLMLVDGVGVEDLVGVVREIVVRVVQVTAM